MRTIALVARSVLLVSLTAYVLTAPDLMAQYRGHAGAPVLTVLGWGSRGAKSSPPKSEYVLKSESTAKFLSLWLTVIPTVAGIELGDHDKHAAGSALVITGMIIGPSTGYFYGHCGRRGAQGILIRAITGGVTAALTVSVADSEFPEGLMAIAVGGAGICAIIYEDIHDISHVKSEVRKHNDKIRSMSLHLRPRFFAQSKAFGLELRATI